MSTHARPTVTPRSTRPIGPALVLGGLFWVANFALILVNGALTGSLPSDNDPRLPLYLRIGLRLFVLAIPILNIGLTALAARLWTRSRTLTIAAGLFMTIAIALSSINLVTLSGLVGTPSFNDTFMGLSIFATSIATGLVAAAALRTGSVSRPVAFLLLFIGLTTIPILFGTPLPFGPDWASDYLAFLTSGMAYVIAGNRVRATERRQQSEPSLTAFSHDVNTTP